MAPDYTCVYTRTRTGLCPKPVGGAPAWRESGHERLDGGNGNAMRYAQSVSPRERVYADALALPEQDRIRLARELLESVAHVALSAEDEAELMDRVAKIDRGGDTVDGAGLLASLSNRRRPA